MRRILTGLAAGTAIVASMAAQVALAQDTFPPHRPDQAVVQLHRLERAVVREQTVGIDSGTYLGLPVIRYTAQQPTCTRAEDGAYGLVVGDAKWFLVQCEPNGEIFTWDAR
jgi:hypothetical protein